MIKEKYKEYIHNSYDCVLERVSGWHELSNVLKILSYYISDCIDTTEDIYNDKDIDYQSYVELNEMISYNLKEVCRIVTKGQCMSNYNSLNRLCSELNRTLGITSDIERENLIRSYYNQGMISYRQYYLLLVSVRKHEYINNVFVSMYSQNWQVIFMIPQRFYLYERLITELYDNTYDKINETNKLGELEKIYNAFCFTSDSYLNSLNYAIRCKKRTELLDLIKKNKIKIKNMIYGRGKYNGKN